MKKKLKASIILVVLAVLALSITVFADPASTKTLHAKWDTHDYTITYNLNGGSLTGQKTTYNIETPTFTLPTPTKSGYTFTGWTGTGLSNATTTVSIPKGSTENRSYTANWSPTNYTISYSLNGGSATGSNPANYNVETNTFTLSNPTKLGYIFTGWTGSNGSTPQTSVTVTKGSTGAKLYTANWSLTNYSISYTLNGGSLTGQKTSYNIETATFTLPAPTKDGCIFTGWTGSNGSTPQTSVTVAKGSIGAKSYTANWEPLALKFSSDSDFRLSAPKKWSGTIEYSTNNGTTWTTWGGGQLSGDSTQPIYLRGTGNSIITNGIAWTFTGKYCTGNIENLLDYQKVANNQHPPMAESCYRRMFMHCTSLKTAPELPAITLAKNCYYGMFDGCTSLTTPPALPATTLADSCYYRMFYGCTSLTTPPALPATTLAEYCYYSMFDGCTSLTTAPALPATTLANYCYYYMFQSCTSLKVYRSSGTGHTIEYKIPKTGTGTSATDALSYMFYGTGGDNIGTPTINTTYYTTNQPIQESSVPAPIAEAEEEEHTGPILNP